MVQTFKNLYKRNSRDFFLIKAKHDQDHEKNAAAGISVSRFRYTTVKL